MGSRKFSFVSRFSFDFSSSHSTEKLREGPSYVSKSFKCEVTKKILKENGISRFSAENFLAQSAEKFRCGTLRYIRKVRLSKNFMPKRMISIFSVEFFSRILPKKLGRNPLCFRIFGTSKTFMLSSGVSRFSFDLFGLTVLKKFVRIPFERPEIFGYRIFPGMRTKNHVLRSNFFVSQYAKNSWERLLSFKKFGIWETFRNFTFFLRFFCLTVAKNFVRYILMFKTVSKVRYRKNLCKRTEHHDFQSKIFCLRVPKNFVGEHFGISEKCGYRKISCLRG